MCRTLTVAIVTSREEARRWESISNKNNTNQITGILATLETFTVFALYGFGDLVIWIQWRFGYLSTALDLTCSYAVRPFILVRVYLVIEAIR